MYLKAFGKAATKARAMTARKLLTDAERAELLGLFQQATIGDGNVWKMFSKLIQNENNIGILHLTSL